jgi:hypothetical protein
LFLPAQGGERFGRRESRARQAAEGAPPAAVASRDVVRRALGAVVALVALGVPADAAPCVVVPGSAVILKSADLDPDVFVWDSKQRVVDYAAGAWRDTHDVLIHSVLAYPGTRAEVVQCDPGIVKPKYIDPLDAIGVRIVSGPNRGRYGWVTSQDIHMVAHSR